jgi:hypothetical protein
MATDLVAEALYGAGNASGVVHSGRPPSPMISRSGTCIEWP